MKIQNKISLIFTALSSGVILALSIFIWFFASESISASFFHRLEVRADIVGHAALKENASKTSIYYDIKERHLGDLPVERHRVIHNAADIKLVSGLNLPKTFYNEIGKIGPSRFFRNDTSYVGLRIKSRQGNITVISSAVDLYGLEEMENLKSLMVIGFMISFVFVFTFGKLYSEEVFKPMRRIIKNVKGINAHNLNQRLSVGDSNDDIEDLSRTFNEVLDRLEITFEMQNNFVSNASHEFKTPLTVISGEAELGLSVPGLPSPAKQSFTNIYREAEKLEHLIGSMLSLAQTGFDGKKEEWGDVRLDELIVQVKAGIDKMSPDNLVDINFDHLPENERHLVVSGNKTLLRAAFSNIILNSCKYSDNRPVHVLIRADDHYAIIEVIDEGIGIPDREIGQIFVPFFRASNTEKYKGYGIGLPLTHNIIRMHQGKVEVSSKVDAGTRFVTYLPFSTI